jgi:hypothetical protein
MKININIIYGLLLGIIVMFILFEVKRNCVLSFNKNKLNEIINVLSRQAARWSTAAKQDKSVLIAVLHANYGAGYLWALKDIATPEQIKASTGIDFLKFEREITSIQDEATKKMALLCPKYAPNKSYLSNIAGEG